MPTFVYSGDETRYYPSLGLLVAPGDVAELPEAPADGRWGPSKTPTAPVSTSASVTASETVTEPTNL